MARDRESRVTCDEIEINLKDPILAGFWAWLWPGAGHLYQGRYAKGLLFMVCILGTYFFGLAITGGHVVYASWTATDKRLYYVCQIGVGLPALPALVQSYRVLVARPPLEPLFGGIMAPPRQPVLQNHPDAKAAWYEKYGFRWDMGELYTMVAGLLNVLAIFDAVAGPVLPSAGEGKKKKDEKEEDDQSSSKK
jgi:hypothetical protein